MRWITALLIASMFIVAQSWASDKKGEMHIVCPEGTHYNAKAGQCIDDHGKVVPPLEKAKHVNPPLEKAKQMPEHGEHHK